MDVEHRCLLLGQQVVSQHLVLKVVVLQPLLGSRLGPLHLRPQRVHVEGVCRRGGSRGSRGHAESRRVIWRGKVSASHPALWERWSRRARWEQEVTSSWRSAVPLSCCRRCGCGLQKTQTGPIVTSFLLLLFFTLR